MQKRSNFNVTFDENFIDAQLADTLLEKCNILFENKSHGRRSSILTGQYGLTYNVTYRGRTSRTPVKNWDTVPELLQVKQRLESISKEHYNFCAIMCYPNGTAVIKKHRDKEIPTGSQICGISLGCTRQFKLSPIHSTDRPALLNLTHGSLYSLQSPTNDHWLHEILPDSSTTPRYSLTFRNIPNPTKITDIKQCSALLKSGPRKGLPCGVDVQNINDTYCGRHNKPNFVIQIAAQ